MENHCSWRSEKQPCCEVSHPLKLWKESTHLEFLDCPMEPPCQKNTKREPVRDHDQIWVLKEMPLVDISHKMVFKNCDSVVHVGSWLSCAEPNLRTYTVSDTSERKIVDYTTHPIPNCFSSIFKQLDANDGHYDKSAWQMPSWTRGKPCQQSHVPDKCII